MGNIRIAYQCLRMMEECVYRDNGSTFRQWEQKVFPFLDDAYRAEPEEFRSHLGASLLGHECPRQIWYDFRWATKGATSGRMQRLFNRGHIEEGRFIALLLTCGFSVVQQDENGHQFRISWANGHAGGSGDGRIHGVPDLPFGVWSLLEFKTHNEKSFTELAGDPKTWRKHLEAPDRNPFKGKGLEVAKPEHYIQMNIYMRKMELATGLYLAVNKNTDDIYAEVITLNSELADQFLDRGEKLVYLDKPPTPISTSPGFWKCLWCDHNKVCHLNAAPAVNCRTCEFSVPRKDGKWHCTKHRMELSKETQLVGCADYIKKRDF